jgi:hypothetical protein
VKDLKGIEGLCEVRDRSHKSDNESSFGASASGHPSSKANGSPTQRRIFAPSH